MRMEHLFGPIGRFSGFVLVSVVVMEYLLVSKGKTRSKQKATNNLRDLPERPH